MRIGGVYTLVDTPDQLTLEGLVPGVDYFLGGSEYTVTDAVLQELIDAGVGSGVPGVGTNLLSTDMASFESSLGTWNSTAGFATATRSTAVASHGTASMSVASTGGQASMLAMSSGTNLVAGAGALAATPGTTYTAMAHFRPVGVSRYCSVLIIFFDATGTIGASTGMAGSDPVNCPADTWTKVTATGAAPANTTQAHIRLTMYADWEGAGTFTAGNTVYVDRTGWFVGTPTYWSPP